MAFFGPVHKSQCRTRSSTVGDDELVLSRQRLWGMEGDRLFVVDPRETYAPLTVGAYELGTSVI
jgi:hypothetical protein